MATWLRYGPLTINNCKTINYVCDDVMDEANQEVISKRHTYTFSAKLNYHDNSYAWDRALNQQASSHVPGAVTLVSIQNVFATSRLKCELGIDDTVIFSAPSPGKSCDNANGPRCVNVSVAEVQGSAGYINGGGGLFTAGRGTIVVRATVIVEVDARRDQDNQGIPLERDLLQHIKVTKTHDVDGDTWLTTITTVAHGRFAPELLNRNDLPDNDLRKQAAYYAYRLQVDKPKGFKRQQARVEVNPNSYELMVLTVDKEEVLPLGTLSPTSKLNVVYTVRGGIPSGEKNGSIVSDGVFQGTGYATNLTSRSSVMELLITLGLQTLTSRKPPFVFLTEAAVSFNKTTNAVDLVMKAKFAPPVNPNQGGLHININAGLDAAADYGDLDIALANSRRAGEKKQGTQRMEALMPEMNMGDLKGSYLGVLMGLVLRPMPGNELRAANDRQDLCTQPASDSYSIQTEESDDYQPEEEEIDPLVEEESDAETEMKLVWETSVPESVHYGFADSGNTIYETVIISTRYTHNSGTYGVPVAGKFPGTSDPVPEQVFVDLYASHGRKEVYWQIRCTSDETPDYPDRDTGDPNDVFERGYIIPQAISPVNNVHDAYTIEGIYYYGRKVAVKSGGNIATGVLPTSLGNQAENSYTSSNAATGMLPKDP